MNIFLQHRCELLIDNNAIMSTHFKKAFDAQIASFGAAMYAAKGSVADVKLISSCKDLIVKDMCRLSAFKNVQVVSLLSVLLSLERDPKFSIEQTKQLYKKLRRFCATDFCLPIVAYILSFSVVTGTSETISRYKELLSSLRLMELDLSQSETYLYAALLCIFKTSEQHYKKSIDRCSQIISDKYPKEWIKHIALPISISENSPQQSCDRLVDIYNQLNKKNCINEVSKESLSIFATLTSLCVPAEEIADNLCFVYQRLKENATLNFALSSNQIMIYAIIQVLEAYIPDIADYRLLPAIPESIKALINCEFFIASTIILSTES